MAFGAAGFSPLGLPGFSPLGFPGFSPLGFPGILLGAGIRSRAGAGFEFIKNPEYFSRTKIIFGVKNVRTGRDQRVPGGTRGCPGNSPGVPRFPGSALPGSGSRSRSRLPTGAPLPIPGPAVPISGNRGAEEAPALPPSAENPEIRGTNRARKRFPAFPGVFRPSSQTRGVETFIPDGINQQKSHLFSVLTLRLRFFFRGGEVRLLRFPRGKRGKNPFFFFFFAGRRARLTHPGAGK